MRAVFLVLSLSVIGMLAALAGMHPLAGVAEAQTERGGCQFQIYLRPAIEFAGPAGTDDFRLHKPTYHRASIQVTNAYGTQPCNWKAVANQGWITLSQSDGTLQADGDTAVTVSINDRATQLSRGVHTGQITFTSRQDPQPSLSKVVKVILHAQVPCDLQVVGGTYRARMAQEIDQSKTIIPAEVGAATLSNSGDAPCEWRAHADVSWLTVSPTSGTVLPRAPRQITIKANQGAANLTPSDYQATVLLQWRETHDEYKEIQATLEVDAPPCDLHFAPGQTLQIRGNAGSTEFTPPQQKFVLENRGGTPCYYWQATGLPNWLEIDDEETIYGKSQTDVLARVNQSAAAQLRPDVYTQTVRFGSGNVSAEHGLPVFIDVNHLPCRLEIIEEDLYFRIEPEGQIESDAQFPITLTNNWKNETCAWTAESDQDWLIAHPSSGTLEGGGQATVTAKIIQNSDAFLRLDSGQHQEQLGFKVASGTSDNAVEVTLDIPCPPEEPCAYLHTTHTRTEVDKPAQVSLTMYNPTIKSITALLRAEVPDGWQVESDSFAEKCGAICSQPYSIAAGQQESIMMSVTPNNPGNVVFNSSVSWSERVDPSATPEAGEESAEDDLERWDTQTLKVDVEVIGTADGTQREAPDSSGADGAQEQPGSSNTPEIPNDQPTAATADQAVHQADTHTNSVAIPPSQSAAAARPASTFEPSEPALTESQTAPPGGGVTAADDRRPGDSGISMNLLILGIAVGVIVVVAAIVAAILIGFKMLANAQKAAAPRANASRANAPPPTQGGAARQ